MHAMRRLALAATAATFVIAAIPAAAALVVISGKLDNLQVVAPVIDPTTGDVIGSTPTKPDGTPVSTSTATGFASVTVDTLAQTITTDFSWTGLSGNADRAHLHDAPAGVTRLLSPPNDRFFHEVINEIFDSAGNDTGASTVDGGFVACGGGLIDPVDWDPLAPCAPASGSLHDFLQLDASRFDPTGQFGFTDFDALLSAFETDGLFLDIHTELYPGGEIRGQLLFSAIPEPTALTLLGFGLLGLLFSGKHFRRADLPSLRARQS
jgi:hypothetical protein